MKEDCGNLPILLCGDHTNLCRWASAFRLLSFLLNQISIGDSNIPQDSTNYWLSTFSPKAFLFLSWTGDITIHGLWEFFQMSKSYPWHCVRYSKPLASCCQQLPFSFLKPSSRTCLWRNSIPSRNGTKETRTCFTQSVHGHPPPSHRSAWADGDQVVGSGAHKEGWGWYWSTTHLSAVWEPSKRGKVSDII